MEGFQESPESGRELNRRRRRQVRRDDDHRYTGEHPPGFEEVTHRELETSWRVGKDRRSWSLRGGWFPVVIEKLLFERRTEEGQEE